MAQLWGGRFTKETDQLVYNFNASLSFDQKLYKQDITGSMAHAAMLAKQGQLWGGRFTKETDQLVYNFNASLSFDQKLYKQDITGSMAHAAMLAKQGILTEEEKEAITEGLQEILADIESGALEFSPEYEDIHSFVEANLIARKGEVGKKLIHSFVEANLIARKGEVGKKLHTGRSRNDQVALDMKMYVRDEIGEIDSLLKELLTSLLHIMKENLHTYMPGFTHLQKAQPVTVAHHFGAY